MKVDESSLLQCRRAVEDKLGWGNSQHWTNVDFETLSDRVFSETGVRLSVSTLKRLWGKVQYTSSPQTATLNALANFIGYPSFRDFDAAHRQVTQSVLTPAEPPAASQPRIPTTNRSLPQRSAWGIGLLTGLFLSLLIAFSLRPNIHDTPSASPTYAFNSRPVTKGIPNSVVFTFDVSQAQTDCLAVQQSWDTRLRFPIRRNQHQATSIYYFPGFFQAKLLVDGRVVNEHDLLIPTSGWLSLINQKPVPVYLPSQGIISDSVMRVPLSVIQANHIPLQPQPPQVHHYNVSNFDPVRTDDFDFTTQVRNEYSVGSAVCQLTQVALILEGSAILIPLSSKGCVSELMLLSIDRQVSGKKADLSAFGVDFTKWVTVRCRGDKKRVQFYINDQLAYQAPAPAKASRLIGLGYAFQGTGAVRRVQLKTADKTVYQAFHTTPAVRP